jgi:hypothetical protein
MTSRRTLIAIAVAGTVAAAGQAHADPSPPVKGGVKCHQSVKRSYPLGKVMRRGLPVKVTCDGPARILVMPNFAANSAADRELYETYGSHIPAVARAKRASLTEAGTITVRPTFTKPAKKILRHHKRTRILVGLGTEREDGHFWSDPGDWSYTALVR